MKVGILRTFGAALLAVLLTVLLGPPWSAQTPVQAAYGPTLPSYSTVFVNAEGLDSCSFFTASDWNTVYRNVPNLLGIGFYLGGITATQDAGCYIASMTWLTNLNNGFEQAPIYDSLQAPCSNYLYQMSSDGDTAHQQGINVADNAMQNWASLGQHAGNIIYLDMEAYSSGCEDTVKRFVNGWVHELHSYTFKAGLYGSACSPHMDDYYGITYPPDDVWIAQYNGNDSAFGVDSSCISDNHWHDRRIHQYTKNSTITKGGVTLSPVDHDCLRGQLDGIPPRGGAALCVYSHGRSSLAPTDMRTFRPRNHVPGSFKQVAGPVGSTVGQVESLVAALAIRRSHCRRPAGPGPVAPRKLDRTRRLRLAGTRRVYGPDRHSCGILPIGAGAPRSLKFSDTLQASILRSQAPRRPVS